MGAALYECPKCGSRFPVKRDSTDACRIECNGCKISWLEPSADTILDEMVTKSGFMAEGALEEWEQYNERMRRKRLLTAISTKSSSGCFSVVIFALGLLGFAVYAVMA